MRFSLSTVRNADRIYVIEGGQVVEEGSHEELIQDENGIYSGLIQRQLGKHLVKIERVSSRSQLLSSEPRSWMQPPDPDK